MRGVIDGGVVTVPDVDVDVASLAPLLREGGEASGQIVGSYDSQSSKTALELVGVRLALSDELVEDRLDGPIRITDEGFVAERLEVDAGRSKFTVNVRESERGYIGSISGPVVDANALLATRIVLNDAGAAARLRARPRTLIFPWNLTILIQK